MSTLCSNELGVHSEKTTIFEFSVKLSFSVQTTPSIIFVRTIESNTIKVFGERLSLSAHCSPRSIYNSMCWELKKHAKGTELLDRDHEGSGIQAGGSCNYELFAPISLLTFKTAISIFALRHYWTKCHTSKFVSATLNLYSSFINTRN